MANATAFEKLLIFTKPRVSIYPFATSPRRAVVRGLLRALLSIVPVFRTAARPVRLPVFWTLGFHIKRLVAPLL
jgi:hypothetical protein